MFWNYLEDLIYYIYFLGGAIASSLASSFSSLIFWMTLILSNLAWTVLSPYFSANSAKLIILARLGNCGTTNSTKETFCAEGAKKLNVKRKHFRDFRAKGAKSSKFWRFFAPKAQKSSFRDPRMRTIKKSEETFRKILEFRKNLWETFAVLNSSYLVCLADGKKFFYTWYPTLVFLPPPPGFRSK